MVFLGHLEDMHHVLDLPQRLVLVGQSQKKKKKHLMGGCLGDSVPPALVKIGLETLELHL